MQMDPLWIQHSVQAADAAFWPALILVIMESETAYGCLNRSSHQGYFRLIYSLSGRSFRGIFQFYCLLMMLHLKLSPQSNSDTQSEMTMAQYIYAHMLLSSYFCLFFSSYRVLNVLFEIFTQPWAYACMYGYIIGWIE